MDSYFGQIGYSFYGGPNGQSFSIKETFPNKVALDADLAAGFTSSIQVGEYVIISYGNPNADLIQYNTNKEIDIAAYNGQTFNATLWQKQYLNERISYGEPITTFATSVPNFIFSSQDIAPGSYGEFYAVKIGANSYSNSECTEDETLVNQALEVENYNEEYHSWEIKGVTPLRYVKNSSVFATKIVEKISSNETNRQYEIKVSNPWDFAIGTITPSDPGGEEPGPTVSITNTNAIKYLNFKLPKPWDIVITKGSDLAANASPSLTLLSNTETAKRWSLQLPAPWNFAIGQVTPSDPGGQGPNVTIEDNQSSNPTAKLLNFTLPKAWDIALGSDSGRVDPADPVSVSIDDDDTTKYVHIKIPDAWNIALGEDSDTSAKIAVNPGALPSVVIDNSGSASNTTKYVHFKLPKAWNFALGKVELLLPNANPEVVLNTENASGVTSVDTKYLHFKLPVAQEFTTDAFTIELLGPAEAARVVTWFQGSDTNHRYPKVELSLPRAEKTKYGSAMAYTSNATISISGSTAADWAAIQELSVGDMYVNTTYAAVHKIVTKTSSQATTEYLGSMQLAIPNVQANGINPYDANGNPVVPTITTSAVGPVATWTVNVDTIKAPVFKKSADSGFVASTATGVISSVAANDGVTYTIKIPRGARINTSTDANISQIVNPFDGDINIDENGILRQYNGNLGRWDSKANLHGNSFSIKNPSIITITASDLINVSGSDLYQKMGNYISDPEQGFPVAYYDGLKENEILNIDYQPETGVSQSRWLYKSNNTWIGSQLTGNISNAIIENTWQDFAEDDKAYSVTRVNELRTTISTLQTKVAAIEAAIEAAWGELPITG